MIWIYLIISLAFAYAFYYNMKKDPLYNGEYCVEMISAILMGLGWIFIVVAVITILFVDWIIEKVLEN